MSNKRIIALLEDQLRLSAERERALTEQLRQQSIQIEELTASIRSLEEALLLKNGHIQTLTNKNRGLGKLISNKSEKMGDPTGSLQVKAQEETATANLKERGNNNAKRKEFFDMETIIEEVYPDDPGFDKEKSRVIGYVDSILYECIPATLWRRALKVSSQSFIRSYGSKLFSLQKRWR